MCHKNQNRKKLNCQTLTFRQPEKKNKLNPKENQSNISNSLLLPQAKSDLDSPSDYFTPKTTNKDSAFYDTTLSLIDLDNIQDKTEIEVE